MAPQPRSAEVVAVAEQADRPTWAAAEQPPPKPMPGVTQHKCLLRQWASTVGGPRAAHVAAARRRSTITATLPLTEENTTSRINRPAGIAGKAWGNWAGCIRRQGLLHPRRQLILLHSTAAVRAVTIPASRIERLDRESLSAFRPIPVRSRASCSRPAAIGPGSARSKRRPDPSPPARRRTAPWPSRSGR
jgi:hypothetical protein